MRFGPLAIVILLLPLAALAEIRGGVRVLDGDTISVQGIQIEIDGIDAPEPEQRCLRDSGRSYACGELATRALRTIIGGRRVRCEELGKTVTGTIRARCRLRRRDLGQEMLALGWALAHEGAARDYAEAQARAETAREGIWSGRFVPPWEWRQGKRIVESPAAPAPPATTAARPPAPAPVIARRSGSAPAPARASKSALASAREETVTPTSAAPKRERPPAAPARAAPSAPASPRVSVKPSARRGAGRHPAGCPIKGNIDAIGRRFYYLPGTKWYNIIAINTEAGERWFCYENDAMAAGWRKFP